MIDINHRNNHDVENAGCSIRETGYLKEQHVFLETSLEEREPDSPQSLAKPVFKREETLALDPNNFEELIREPSHESDDPIDSTWHRNEQQTRALEEKI